MKMPNHYDKTTAKSMIAVDHLLVKSYKTPRDACNEEHHHPTRAFPLADPLILFDVGQNDDARDGQSDT
jgi:hypothetical protein